MKAVFIEDAGGVKISVYWCHYILAAACNLKVLIERGPFLIHWFYNFPRLQICKTCGVLLAGGERAGGQGGQGDGTGQLIISFGGLGKVGLVPPRVFSLKRPTAGVWAF